jgi:hypothetical protein
MRNINLYNRKITVWIFFFIFCNPFGLKTSYTQDILYETIENNANGNQEISFYGDDALLSNIWLPDDVTGGLPIEIVFCADVNKYYVYSSRNLIVIDGISHEIIKRIDICDVSLRPRASFF